MKASKDILNELREIAPALSGLDKKNFYTVSEGYFEESGQKIMMLAVDVQLHGIDLPPVLASIKKKQLHSAPEGYFSSFTDNVIGQIQSEEVAEELTYTAPLLVGLEKKEAYSVPANYIADFPANIYKVAAREAAAHDTLIEHEISVWSIWIERILTVVSRPKYSFAMACMVAIVVMISVVYSHSTLTPEEKIFAQMQQVPDSELHHYIGKHRDEFDERTILYHINDIEFSHYFDKPENVPAHLKGAINTGPDNIDNLNEDVID